MSGPPPLTTSPARIRIDVVDAIRGVALLGLPLIHVFEFGMEKAFLFNPTELSPTDQAAWYLVALLGTGKFISIFGLLFGAGLVLSSRRSDELGQPVGKRFSRRFAALLLIGLLHAYLIWHGDILVGYALIGFVLFWIRGWPLKRMKIMGAVLLAVIPAVALLLGVILLLFDPFDFSELSGESQESDEYDQWVNDNLDGGWFQQLPARALIAFMIQILGVPFLLSWFSGGLMMLGMVGARTGFLTGEKPKKIYRKLALRCLPLGLGLGLLGKLIAYTQQDHAWVLSLLLFVGYGAVLVTASGYLNALLWWSKSSPDGLIWKGLRAVGRMALTNYLSQSIFLGLVFYGHGLGLRGDLPAWGCLMLCPLIWVLQATFSLWWLKRFRFGPVEWLWRCAIYWRGVPIRRAQPASD